MKRVFLATLLFVSFSGISMASTLGQDLGFEKCTEHVQSSRLKGELKNAKKEIKNKETKGKQTSV